MVSVDWCVALCVCVCVCVFEVAVVPLLLAQTPILFLVLLETFAHHLLVRLSVCVYVCACMVSVYWFGV